MGAPALPVVSAVLTGGAIVVHRPSGPVCPSLVLPVPFLSFCCCGGATFGGWILDGESHYVVPLLGRRCFPRVVVSGQVVVLGHFVLTWHARGTGLIVACRHGSGCSVVPCLSSWSWRCLLLSWCCGCALSSPASFHPSSTPRAVAREAGDGQCVVVLGPAVISCHLGVLVSVSALASLLDCT